MDSELRTRNSDLRPRNSDLRTENSPRTVQVVAYGSDLPDADVLVESHVVADEILAAPKAAANPTIGVSTNFDFSNNVYATNTSSIPIIRNEELILLRAEARYYRNDGAGALDDLNTIRTRAGSLPAKLATDIATETAFLDELLYNRRWSLLFEGHRWIDHRRFGRLNDLPIDLASHVRVSRLPVPQAECLSRSLQTTPEMRGPGCN